MEGPQGFAPHVELAAVRRVAIATERTT